MFELDFNLLRVRCKKDFLLPYYMHFQVRPQAGHPEGRDLQRAGLAHREGDHPCFRDPGERVADEGSE